MASKKKRATESVHDRDRIIVRLPDGMRARLAAQAQANARSVTAEVVAAIEQHLEDDDRISQLWQFFELHRWSIEAVPRIWDAVEDLEKAVEGLTGGRVGGLRAWRLAKMDESREDAGTTDQAARSRELQEEAAALRAQTRSLEERIRALVVPPEKKESPPA